MDVYTLGMDGLWERLSHGFPVITALGLVLSSLSFSIFVGCAHYMGGISCHCNSPEKVCGSRGLENNSLCDMLHFHANL